MTNGYWSSAEWISRSVCRRPKLTLVREPELVAVLIQDSEDDDLFPWIPEEEFMLRIQAYDRMRGIWVNGDMAL